MVLGEHERRAKLHTVAEALGYESVFALLNVYTSREIVPVFCTQWSCHYITNVERDATQVRCGHCQRASVQSILTLAQLF